MTLKLLQPITAIADALSKLSLWGGLTVRPAPRIEPEFELEDLLEHDTYTAALAASASAEG